jgi:Ca2+-binding EF-hand superfamily protein
MDLKALMNEFPEILKTIIKSTFIKLDTDCDNYITSGDLKAHFNLSSSHLQVIMTKFDPSGSGAISKKRFKRVFLELINLLY